MTGDERDGAQGGGNGQEQGAGEQVHTVEFGGDTFVWREETGASVEIVGPEGQTLASVIVPTDLIPDATEDEIRHSAFEHYSDVTTLEERFTAAHLEATVADLERDGTFRAIADMAADVIRGGLVLAVTDDDTGEPGPLDDLGADERRAVAERAMELARSEAAGVVERVFLTGAEAPAFKANFVRGVLTHAWAWAIADARLAAGELEALAGGDEQMPPDAFEELVNHTFRDGPYATRAVLTLATETAQAMAEQVARAFSETPELARKLAEQARQEVRYEAEGRRKPSPPKTLPPPMQPGFDADGFGLIPSDRITRGWQEAVQNAADGATGWREGPDGWLYYLKQGQDRQGRAWATTYSPARDAYADADAARAAVLQLDDAYIDTGLVALAIALANPDRRGPNGVVYADVDAICEQLGTPKHKHGGYATDERRAVVEQMEALGKLDVEGRGLTRWEPDEKGKKRQVQDILRGRFLVISSRHAQLAFDGSEKLAGWFYRPGDWAAAFMSMSDGQAREVALLLQPVLRYHAKNDRYLKRLGLYFAPLFRIRANDREGKQPYVVGHLLADANLTPSDTAARKNPKRVRETVEGALDQLQHDGVVGQWRYKGDFWPLRSKDKPHRLDRGWFAEWMNARLIVEPPAVLIERYRPIGERRLAALPRGGQPVKKGA